MPIHDKNFQQLKQANFSVKQARGIMSVLLDREDYLVSKSDLDVTIAQLKTEIVKYLLVQFLAILGVVLTIISIIMEQGH